ncbi:IclR family transcriptional regulator [Halobacteriales archaeon Cl-PHB]
MIQESSSRDVKSVRTAFRIVDILQAQDGATMNDLVNKLALAKSTIHNYLGTLQSMGYVVERDGTYRLGLHFLTHGMAAKNGLEVGDAVSEVLQTLSESLSQVAWWVVEEHGRGVFVAKSTPDGEDPIYGRVGKRSYLHTHAPGMAILARSSPEFVEAVVDYHGLPVHTQRTTTDLEDLRADLEEIREQGYAVSDGEAALGVRSVGVSFEGPAGNSHGIGVFGHSHDFGVPSEQDIHSVLRDAAADLDHSARVGGA